MDKDPTRELTTRATDLVVAHRSASVSFLQRHMALNYSQAMSLMLRLAEDGAVEEPNPVGRYHVSLDRLSITLQRQPERRVHARTLCDLAVYLLENRGQEDTRCLKILAAPFPYRLQELRAVVARARAGSPQELLLAVASELAATPAMSDRMVFDDIREELVQECSLVSLAMDGGRDSTEARQRGLTRAMRYLQRRIMEGADPDSRAVDCFVHRSLVPRGSAEQVRKAWDEHVVPCAFLQRRATELLRHGIPADEVATWIEPYLRIVEIDEADADRLDGPERLKFRMPAGWRFDSGCIYARLHRLNIRFTPPAEGPGCTCEFHAAVGLALGKENLERSGATLYSSVQTLRPGALYLMGTNPGGSSGRTVRESLQHLLRGAQNAYFDEEWDAHSRQLQLQVQALLRAVAPAAERQVCASNLIFFRSATQDQLPSFWDDARTCWPVHRHLLSLVRPRLLIAFGNGPASAYGFLRKILPNAGPRDLFRSGHGNSWCEGFRTSWEGAPLFVAGLPHLSRHGLSERGELRPLVARWLRHRLDDPAGEPPAFLAAVQPTATTDHKAAEV